MQKPNFTAKKTATLLFRRIAVFLIRYHSPFVLNFRYLAAVKFSMRLLAFQLIVFAYIPAQILIENTPGRSPVNQILLQGITRTGTAAKQAHTIQIKTTPLRRCCAAGLLCIKCIYELQLCKMINAIAVFFYNFRYLP